MNKNNLIIFDGICSLCNGFVDFVIRKDKKKIFYFTSNQEESGQRILSQFPAVPKENVLTIYYMEDGKLYSRSTAVLRIARLLPFPYSLLYGFMIIPVFIRNAVYNFVARNRYRWFGRRDTCRVPTAEEKERFI